MNNLYHEHYESIEEPPPLETSSEMQRLHKIISMIPPDVKTLLDCGCGDGRLGNMIKDKYDLQGCDISTTQLKRCEFPTTQCRVEELPFDDGQFDMVICGEVLEHILPDFFEKACHEIDRVAKKWVLITVPNQEDMDSERQKCPHCGTIFHNAWHVRSMSQKMLEKAFPGFIVRDNFLMGQKRRLDIILRAKLRNRLRGYPKLCPTLQCPFCGRFGTSSGRQQPEPTAAPAPKKGWYPSLRRFLRSLLPGKPIWLGVLFERRA